MLWTAYIFASWHHFVIQTHNINHYNQKSFKVVILQGNFDISSPDAYLFSNSYFYIEGTLKEIF